MTAAPARQSLLVYSAMRLPATFAANNMQTHSLQNGWVCTYSFTPEQPEFPLPLIENRLPDSPA